MRILRGKIISVSGIDGSGKTTCIEHLRRYYADQSQSSRYVWLRYNHYFTKFLLVFCRLIGLTHYQKVANTRVGYHDFYRSNVLSHVFIWLTLLDTFLASLVFVYIPSLCSRSIIICDRWVPDILIDLEIDTHIPLGKNSVYGKLFWALIPPTTQILVVQRDYDTVLRARIEHTIDKNLQQRFQLYAQLENEAQLHNIDNSGTVEEMVNTVIKVVSL